MPCLALTDLSIRALKADERIDFWDIKTPAFGIRVGARSKTFITKLENRRITIGPYPDLSLQEARKRALSLKSNQTKPLAETAFLEAYKAFRDIHCSQKRPRTQRDYSRILDKHFLPKLRGMRLDAITHRNIAEVTDQLIDTPSEHSHALAVGRTFFKFCVRRHYIAASPLEGVQLPKSTPRDRVLSNNELRRIWQATESAGSFDAIVRLLILTGQRCGEVAALETSWIKNDTITLPKEATKNGREHTFPIGKSSTVLLDLALIGNHSLLFPARGHPHKPFNGWSKSKLALDKKLGPDFKPWTLHDLRRTFATNLAALGVRMEVTEKLLNHVSGSFAGVTGIYQRHEFKAEMRDAIEMWEKHLKKLLA